LNQVKRAEEKVKEEGEGGGQTEKGRPGKGGQGEKRRRSAIILLQGL